MIRLALTWLVAALAVAAPASASAEWVHGPSGIRVPDRIGDDLVKGEVRDASDGKQTNVWVQYGAAGDLATIYVYRSAFPDAGLWFHRTEAAMRGNVGLTDAAAPVEATLFGAAAPNALRQVYTLDGSKGFRSTALLFVNHGEWLVKVRLSSQALDAAALGARLDRLVAAMTVPAPAPAKARPIGRVGDCADAIPAGAPAKVVDDRKARTRVLVEGGAAAQIAARGQSGLAAGAVGWCRQRDPRLDPFATLFRTSAGADWILLIGDSGVAAATAGTLTPNGPKHAGLFLATPERTALIDAFEQTPPIEAGIVGHVLPVLQGKRGTSGAIETDPKGT